MSIKNFTFRLILYSIASLVAVFGYNQIPLLAPYLTFSLQTIAFFALLSIFFYIFAKLASGSRNIYMFNNIIMATSLIKLVLCFMVIYLYHKNMQPANNYFIIPFFTLYIIYTLFELDFMGKLARK